MNMSRKVKANYGLVVSKITLIQYKIHYNQFQAKGGETFPTLYSKEVLNVLSMKQEFTSNEFSSLQQ